MGGHDIVTVWKIQSQAVVQNDRNSKVVLVIAAILLLLSVAGGVGYYFGTKNTQTNVLL